MSQPHAPVLEWPGCITGTVAQGQPQAVVLGLQIPRTRLPCLPLAPCVLGLGARPCGFEFEFHWMVFSTLHSLLGFTFRISEIGTIIPGTAGLLGGLWDMMYGKHGGTTPVWLLLPLVSLSFCSLVHVYLWASESTACISQAAFPGGFLEGPAHRRPGSPETGEAICCVEPPLCAGPRVVS